MEVNKIVNDNNMEVVVKGRIDTVTAPILDSEINSVENITNLVINFKDVEYVSSAGLRVLLSSQKKFNKLGKMVITNVCEDVMEVFDMTGFSDILTIE